MPPYSFCSIFVSKGSGKIVIPSQSLLKYSRFINFKTMKKFSIPLILMLATLGIFGCSKKGGNAAGDTTINPPPGMMGAGVATAQIVPPQAAAQPILVTTQANMAPDSVSFSAVFTGSQAQTVTLGGGPAAPKTLSPTNPSITQCAPPNGTNLTVTAVDAPLGSMYTLVNIAPTNNPNLTGNLTTTYSDATGNSVAITIKDLRVNCGK
jgi:hypothetical protein